jgi:hypothetical protein
VLFRNRFADGLEDRLQMSPSPAFHFVNDHQAFPAVLFNGESSPSIGPKPRVGMLDCEFDILRINIPTSEDNNVFDPPSDKKLTLVEETEITGTEEWSFPGITDIPSEGDRGGLGPIPVAHGHTWTLDPDFPDMPFGKFPTAIRVYNQDPLVGKSLTATDKRPGSGGMLRGRNGPPAFQSIR